MNAEKIAEIRERWTTSKEEAPEDLPKEPWAAAIQIINAASERIRNAMSEGDQLAWDLCKLYFLSEKDESDRRKILDEAQAAFDALGDFVKREIQERDNKLYLISWTQGEDEE